MMLKVPIWMVLDRWTLHCPHLSLYGSIWLPDLRSSPNAYHGHHHIHHHHHHPKQYEDPTAYEDHMHNIFDVSASSTSSTASSAFPTHFSSSTTPTMEEVVQGASQVAHTTLMNNNPFNSSFPVINSTMRYDPRSSLPL